jgi:hypothetical protein
MVAVVGGDFIVGGGLLADDAVGGYEPTKSKPKQEVTSAQHF